MSNNKQREATLLLYAKKTHNICVIKILLLQHPYSNNYFTFTEWCMETTGSITDFDTIGKADLNEKLRHFYAEAKPKYPEKRAKHMPTEHENVYHKNTLKNVRAALNRHIKHLNRHFDIVRDIEFRTSNIILDSTMKMMVGTGLSRATKHKEIIEIDDLQLISTYLFKDINDPILLPQRVWYCLAVYFVL